MAWIPFLSPSEALKAVHTHTVLHKLWESCAFVQCLCAQFDKEFEMIQPEAKDFIQQWAQLAPVIVAYSEVNRRWTTL